MRSALVHERDRLIEKQCSHDEDANEYLESGNDAMLYQSLIDKIDRLLKASQPRDI